MSGIVLFMLAGRWFQNKTYDSFSFDRDYKSYFPLGITKIEAGKEIPATISSLHKDDHIIVRHGEMVPADSVLINGEASIDYSFVSGENTPVVKNKGELIYAGAKQLGGSIELQVIKTVNQSYITQLWNNNEFFEDHKNGEKSFIHPWSRYFTIVLFSLCTAAGIYWAIFDPSNILPAISASLIVACPCMLLLSATFTFGNMLRYFGKNKLYLKNATVIETLSKINHIVFDKTGTLTYSSSADIEFVGGFLFPDEKKAVYSLVKESAHPLSRLVKAHLLQKGVETVFPVKAYKELPGKGTEAVVNGHRLKIGSAQFVAGYEEKKGNSAEVWVSIDGSVRGYFCIHNLYRDGVEEMIKELEEKEYKLHLLSGDNNAERKKLQTFFGNNTPMLFKQSPQDKLEYIKSLKQSHTSRVMMLGDGLNDAGALKQSDVGIAVTENTSQFTPASDGILDSNHVQQLPAFISYARAGKRIVMWSWILSFMYNAVGLRLSIALQAKMSPMAAAILMPMTSITIVTFVSVATSIAAKRRGL
jgi:P-type Cu+ transporter